MNSTILNLSNTNVFFRYIFCFLLIISGYSYSQVAISYPTPAEDIVSNYNSSILRFKISFASTCDPINNNTVRIKFPQNVTYVPGSIGSAISLAFLNLVEDDISDLRQPIFRFVGGPSATEGTFTIRRRAGCVTGATFKDSIEVLGASCTVVDYDNAINNYNIQQASLAMVSPTPIVSATIGSTHTRTIKITNGGNGAIDTLYFYVVYPTGAIQNTNSDQLTLGGVDFSPVATNGDTLFYQFFGSTVFGGDSKLDANETINITEPIEVLSCNATTTVYNVGWGESLSILCQNASVTGTISLVSGAANFLKRPDHNDINFVDYCTPWRQSADFRNDGAGDVEAASMYNVKVKFGTYSGLGNWGANGMHFILSDFQVNGHSVPSVGSNATTYYMNFEDLFTTDPDGPGGLDDLDGDGYYDDLAPGETINLDWMVQFDCGTTCGRNSVARIGSIMIYDDMCGDEITSPIRILNPYKLVETTFASSAYISPNIVDGGTYRFEFHTTYGGNTNTYFGTNGRYEYRLVLPPGFSVAPVANAKYGTASIGYTMSGDTVIIRSINNTFKTDAGIDLVYHCGVTGPVDFYHSLRKIQDYTNSCVCMAEMKYCDVVSSYVQCPTACAEGPTNYQPIVRRTDGSLGWTNNTLTTRQSASNISAFDLCKAMYLDTIQITGSATQNNDASNLHLRLELPTTAATNTTKKLSPINTDIEIWRGGVKIHTCTMTSSTDMTVNGMQKIDWDVCLPVGGILAGDSIYSISRYVVARNAGLPQEDVQSGDSWYFYNDNGGVEEYCNKWLPEMYLVGTRTIIGSNATNANGCQSFVPGSGFAYMARRFNTNGIEYQSEFRPMVYIDSIVLTITDGYDYVNAVLTQNAGYNSPASTISLTPDHINGNTYTFINPGTWGIMGITKTNVYGGNFKPTVSTNCKTTNTEQFNTKIYIKDYYYAFGSPSSVPATYNYILGSSTADIAGASPWTYNMKYVESTRPDITIQNMTGTVQTTDNVPKYWDVKVSNNSTSKAPYVWLAIEKGNGNGTINVTSVEDLTNGVTLTSVGSYSCVGTTGYKWYKFSTAGLNLGTSNSFRVHFEQTGCNADSVLFKAGWNCYDYPLTPCDYSCSAEEIYLKVRPEPAEIQLSIAHQPNNGAKMDLCTEDYVTILVNSTQAADLLQPQLTMLIPTGMNLNVAGIEVEYPLNSGNFQHPTVSIMGNQLLIDVASHTAIGSAGILGVVNASNNDQSVAAVKIPFSLFCDYVSGKSLTITGFGNEPCGNPAIGNGKSISTNSIKIDGIPENGGATSHFLTSGPFDFECNQITTLEYTASTWGETSQPGDKLVYTLPSGITYAGNFSSVPTGASVSTSGSDVIVSLPSGKSNFTISFDIQSDCDDCNHSAIFASYQRSVDGISCGGVACDGYNQELSITNIGVNCYDPLPVTLINFSANSKDCNVEVNWSTATERSNDYFELFRSEDGQEWKKIGEIKGNGNSSTQHNYQWIDQEVTLNTTYYYLLNQVDFDGKSETFDAVSVVNNSCSSQTLEVYPNPVEDVVYIKLPFLVKEDVLVNVLDASGKLIQSESFSTTSQMIVNRLNDIQSGVYQIEVKVGETTFPIKKVVKL